MPPPRDREVEKAADQGSDIQPSEPRRLRSINQREPRPGLPPKKKARSRSDPPRPTTPRASRSGTLAPRIEYQKTARKAVAAARRRGHAVRGHPRTLHRGQPNEFKIQILSHKRGDESLGWVHHDYTVGRKGLDWRLLHRAIRATLLV
jgi:hypothetical protein